MNFKVKCIKPHNNEFIAGKEYIIKNGILISENEQSFFRVGDNIESINNILFSQFELVEEKEQTLKEKYILNAPDDVYVVFVLEHNSNRRVWGMIFNDKIHYEDGGYGNLGFCPDNLEYSFGRIIKIFYKECVSNCSCVFNEKFFDENTMKLVWERPKEMPEYTVEELIEKIGHEFKIKK